MCACVCVNDEYVAIVHGTLNHFVRWNFFINEKINIILDDFEVKSTFQIDILTNMVHGVLLSSSRGFSLWMSIYVAAIQRWDNSILAHQYLDNGSKGCAIFGSQIQFTFAQCMVESYILSLRVYTLYTHCIHTCNGIFHFFQSIRLGFRMDCRRTAVASDHNCVRCIQLDNDTEMMQKSRFSISFLSMLLIKVRSPLRIQQNYCTHSMYKCVSKPLCQYEWMIQKSDNKDTVDLPWNWSVSIHICQRSMVPFRTWSNRRTCRISNNITLLLLFLALRSSLALSIWCSHRVRCDMWYER